MRSLWDFYLSIKNSYYNIGIDAKTLFCEDESNINCRNFIEKYFCEFACKARNYYVLYNGKETEVEYVPEKVFEELGEKA